MVLFFRGKWSWLAALAIVVVLTSPERAAAIEAPLLADAHVNSARPGANSGAISNLNVGAGYTALVQFDLGALPAGTTATQVSRALLRLYCNRADTPGLVSVQPVGAAWGEYSITYSTLPTLGAATQVVTVSQTGAFVWIDVTSLVQGWLSIPANNNGVALTAGTAAVQFDSKENDLTGHAPELDITLVSQGPKGDTGSQGPAGSVGAAGPSGPTGATGPAGLQGLQGVKGDTGAQGTTGPAGSTGPAGPTGPTGLQGPQGLSGPAGSPGLVYQGNYASTTNYALGDVVLWQGASYVSLVVGNHGNTPSASPPYWGELTAQGPAGPQGAQGVAGATGLQGPPGSVGPPGEQGPQGLQGIAGQAGAQGIPGVQGPQGTQGPIGVQGQAGPVGMSFQGAYSSARNYALGDGVMYGSSGYVSLIDSNHGNTPDQSPAAWAVFATGTAGSQGPAGSVGAQGPAGQQGLQGPQGATGPQGPQGSQGPAVANYTGNYTSTRNYALNDAVSYDGSTYISLVAGNTGHTPPLSTVQWAVLAAQGPAGATGPAGPQGPVGPTGAAGATGAAGPQGSPVSFAGGWLTTRSYAVGDAVSYGGGSYIALVANTGRQPDISVSYWGLLAQAGVAGTPGATGAQGPQGVQGVPGISFKGTWSVSSGYVMNDAVFYNGSTYVALATSLAAQPDLTPVAWALLAQAGSAGATGPAGTAARITIGTVTTGAAGSQAAVTNSGTTSAAVLDFVLPQGAPGASGGGGGGSTSGVPFASVYHAVSFNAVYYSVNSANSAATETDQVLTWVPAGCAVSQLSVYSRQSNTITVTLRTGSPGAMANTSLSCAAANSGSCTATGAITVPSGGFIDLSVSGASGTAAAVWTAVACN